MFDHPLLFLFVYRVVSLFSVVTMSCSDQFKDLPNAGNRPFGNGGRYSAVSFALLFSCFCFQSDADFVICTMILPCSVLSC